MDNVHDMQNSAIMNFAIDLKHTLNNIWCLYLPSHAKRLSKILLHLETGPVWRCYGRPPRVIRLETLNSGTIKFVLIQIKIL